MTQIHHSNELTHTPTGLVVVGGDVDPATIDSRHLADLLNAATTAAIEGALHNGNDVPVGAATSRDGKLLAASYAQDNLINDPRAHAEFMAMELTKSRHPNIQPDTIAVTLEPCISCQDYLAQFPDLKVVAFALPLASASIRNVIRPKESTIFQRHQHDPLPYTVIQLQDERLTRLGQLLLSATTRDITTGETSIDVATLRSELSKLQ